MVTITLYLPVTLIALAVAWLAYIVLRALVGILPL